MASSGSITTGQKEGRSVTLSWTLTSQNIEKNTSTIAWKLKGSGGSSTSWVMAGGFKAVINGTTVYSTSTDNRIKLYNGTVVASGSTTISHNADGTKSFSLSCQAGVYTYAVNVTASGTHTLNTIPRASSVKASNVNMGSAATITISRVSSSFTHTLTYKFGNVSGTIVSKTSSISVSWTPSLSLARQIPSAVSGTCTITCNTYSGSTKVGSKTCTHTLTVPSSVKPTIGNLSVTRINGDVPSSWGIYVQTKSKAIIQITGAAGSYGSSVKSYSISGGGYSGTADRLTTGFLNTSGTITFTATVTDSRGRVSNAKTTSISVVDYAPPYINSVVSQRALSNGSLNDDGTYIRGVVSFGYSSCGGKNTLSCSQFYKKNSDANWTSGGVSFHSDTPFTFGNGKISTESTYDVKYSLTDAFCTISAQDIVSTAAVVMDFKSGGKGVAIGKVSETDNCFEIASSWSVKKKGSVESDFVISQGTSGIWTYRKWKSGIAECWCRKTITTNITNVWGGLYTSGRLDALDISFPFAFKSAPVVTANLTTNWAGAILMVPGDCKDASTTSTGTFELARGSAIAGKSYIVNFHVIGMT